MLQNPPDVEALQMKRCSPCESHVISHSQTERRLLAEHRWTTGALLYRREAVDTYIELHLSLGHSTCVMSHALARSPTIHQTEARGCYFWNKSYQTSCNGCFSQLLQPATIRRPNALRLALTQLVSNHHSGLCHGISGLVIQGSPMQNPSPIQEQRTGTGRRGRRGRRGRNSRRPWKHHEALYIYT